MPLSRCPRSQLCEVIIKVLRAQACPAPLQAHQIQGGDFVACFPVVRWLVTKVRRCCAAPRRRERP
jgi:hypothetical protein